MASEVSDADHYQQNKDDDSEWGNPFRQGELIQPAPGGFSKDRNLDYMPWREYRKKVTTKAVRVNGPSIRSEAEAVNNPQMIEYNADWIIVGCKLQNDQYMVLASDQLTKVELQCEMESFDLTGDDGLLSRHSRYPNYTLFAKFDRFVVTLGGTYALAFKHLMEQWHPETIEDEPMKAIS